MMLRVVLYDDIMYVPGDCGIVTFPDLPEFELQNSGFKRNALRTEPKDNPKLWQ